MHNQNDMGHYRWKGRRWLVAGFACLWGWAFAQAQAQAAPVTVSLDWDKIVAVSKANVSIQACIEPPMRRGYPIHDRLFKALRDLKPDYARLQPWHPYPRLAVAELHPPKDGKTFWDFTLLDPIVEDFMLAVEGRPVVVNFGAIPAWMFKTQAPDRIPDDPDEIAWDYSINPEFTDFDSTVRLFAQYQARLAGWYLNGGFRDEFDQWHESGHRYSNIAYWEILNEPDFEHGLSPRQVTQLYDAVVTEVRKVAPSMKFMGPAMAKATSKPEYFTYFLDPKNHQPGIPIDAVSYHFYFEAESDETPDVMQHTIFQQADKLLTAAAYIDSIRRHFSPHTKTAINELGTILPFPAAAKLPYSIPDSYWNLSGAMWAYLYGHLAAIGIDMIHGSELIDYPGQVPSATLVDWETGQPNARYWVLKLLRDNFGPGDRLLAPRSVEEYSGPDPGAQVYAQGFISPQGERKVLLVNKRNKALALRIPGAAGGDLQKVDQSTTTVERRALSSNALELPGLAVAVVTLGSADPN